MTREEQLEAALRACEISMDTAAHRGLPQQLPPAYRESWVAAYKSAEAALARAPDPPPDIADVRERLRSLADLPPKAYGKFEQQQIDLARDTITAIDRLTAERDAAIAKAVAERTEACLQIAKQHEQLGMDSTGHYRGAARNIVRQIEELKGGA